MFVMFSALKNVFPENVAMFMLNLDEMLSEFRDFYLFARTPLRCNLESQFSENENNDCCFLAGELIHDDRECLRSV